MAIPGIASPTIDVVLPSWIPGSYNIQDPSRTVRDVRARGADAGPSLPVERIDKARWRVTTQGLTSVEVTYIVYGHRMENDWLDVTPEHLFLNAAVCLPYVDGRKDEPYELALILPPDWKVFTELAPVGPSPARFRARDYDELVDSPVDCGTPVELQTTAAGVPHRIVLCGHGGNYEAHRLEEDVRRIAEASIRLFGESPVAHYTFFYHLNDIPDGGLEHRFSSSMVVPRSCFKPESLYRHFLLVTAHEYLHLYNVKRLRPKVLGPFDYTRENYTRLLWAMEGTTDYYAHLILRRAGLVGPAKTLERLAKEVAVYLKTPGRAVLDLETASFQTWVDLYRWYEETPNQSVSYYRKGLLVSLCLDLEIRHRTENRQSLDTVFRSLWREFGAPGRGLEEDGLEPALERYTGLELAPFFAKYVRGTEEIDFGAFARYAGLSFGEKPRPSEPEEDEPAGHLSVEFEEHRGSVRLTQVLDGGAGRRAGLSPGDEVVAMNGERVHFADFTKRLESFPAGSEVTFSVFRRGWLTSVKGSMGKAPPEKYQFSPVANATPLERAIYEEWLAAKWEAPKAEPSSPT